MQGAGTRGGWNSSRANDESKWPTDRRVYASHNNKRGRSGYRARRAARPWSGGPHTALHPGAFLRVPAPHERWTEQEEPARRGFDRVEFLRAHVRHRHEDQPGPVS